MTFNGLTDGQAEASRKKYGGCLSESEQKPAGLKEKLKERFSKIPVKVYIILFLIYIALGIFLAVNGNVTAILSALPIIPAAIIPMVINCLTELHFERSAFKHTSKPYSRSYKAFRCGNTVTEIPMESIVKGDYLLLTAGDISPADGIVLHGDITAEKDGGSKLIRNFRAEEITEDISGSYTVERDAVISSGYAVVKIISVEGGKNPLRKVKKSKSYTLGIILSVIFSAALTAFYVFCCPDGGICGANTGEVVSAALLYFSLIFLASEWLEQPREFFRNACAGEMRHGGVKAAALRKPSDFTFVDKSAFAADGKPVVTGYTDGSGRSYVKFYEIPYPLGTILARAAAENTSALVNRGNIFGSDAHECAVMRFVSERIKNTLDLEITPEVIKGAYNYPQCKRLLGGSPAEIIGGCEAYFDGAGNVKRLSNTAALSAMAEELIFQGSRVFAYAAENYDGSKIFIGMVTVHEKLRSSAANAYRAMRSDGVPVIMLAEGSSAEAVSIADKAVTGAGIDEIIPFERLEEMPLEEAARVLRKIKIITGKTDREKLVKIVHDMKKTVGITACDYRSLEESAEADVIYAASSGCMAAKSEADAILYDGLASMLNYNGYCRRINSAAVGYNILRIFMLALSAVMMNAAVVNLFGSIVYYTAIAINILFCAAACAVFGKISGNLSSYPD
ncbi:MAG: hypothetical protein LUI05_00960 [Oscillospiraceae bacterium]|nr:hypothetical protein [Oscillospiraceae bacterium]